MNLSQKRKLKLQLHKALRYSLYLIRNFQNKENLENDEKLEKYVKMTKEKFGDIITKLRNEIKMEEQKK